MRMSDGSSDVCSSDLLLGSAPPQDLAAFRQWWLSEPGLDTIGPRGRIAPQGEAGAGLMVLVMDPEAGDSQSLPSGRSDERRVGEELSVGVDLGGRRLINNKKQHRNDYHE